jgi:ubiquinone/menaquinone biosynthesis C-methylase UbiE
VLHHLASTETASAADLLAIDRSEIIHAILRTTINTSLLFERAMLVARRALLEAIESQHDVPLRLLVSMAGQAWNNGYIWQSTADEVARADALPRSAAAAALRCAYSPLREADVNVLTSEPLCADLLLRQWEEPRIEREIAKSLDRGIDDVDEVSARVRMQYEENPYPRWLKMKTQTVQLHAPATALIAGCGTGREALWFALRHPTSQVTAIDISLRSLAYGARKAAELGVANVTFRHSDLRRLGDDELFDSISSVGVLHHLADPVDGLRTLARHLRRGGEMKVGLYSRAARRWVRELRALCGSASTHDELLQARARIFESVAPHELSNLECLDFFEIAHFRDTLFHTHQIEISMRELREWIAAADLHFAGFEDLHPSAQPYAAVKDLRAWEEIEEGLFESMYVARLVR